MSSVTSTQFEFTVTSRRSGLTCRLTWQNVRVRPTVGTLPPGGTSGSLGMSGTASVVGVSTNSNFGVLREVAGAASNLAIQTQPSTTATAGLAFPQQPVIQVRDQFGNLRNTANGSSDNSAVVTAARSAGSGTLQGVTNLMAADGVVTFTNLSHTVATNITLTFSSGALTGAESGTIAVGPAAASALAFAIQPGGAVAGSNFGTQPVVLSRDQFGNNSTLGLPLNLNLSLSLNQGAGPLQGTTTLDIGTAAGNGAGAFVNLRVHPT